MKKIINLWKDNKVVIMLIAILIICFIAICVVALTYFFGGSGSEYGDRLEGIENYPITEEIKNSYINTLKENEDVKDVTFKNQGKVLYITIIYNEKVDLETAQSTAEVSIDSLDSDYIAFYDINFTVKKDATEDEEGFILMGARNVSAGVTSWNVNTPPEEDEE